jgi:hypothetical protein
MESLDSHGWTSKEIGIDFITPEGFSLEEDKICGRCGVIKPLDAFSKNVTRPDGHQTECRECAKLYQAEWIDSQNLS